MDSHTLVLFFSHLSTTSVLLPIFFLCWNRNNFKDPLLKALFFLLALGGLTDLFSYIVGFVWKQSTFAIINFEFVLEFFLVSILFVRAYPKIKKIATLMAIVFLLLFVDTSIFLQPINTYQSITRVAASIIFIAYSIAYYIYLMKELPTDNILYYTPFWVIAAIFFYFSMNLYIFSLSSYVFANLSPQYAVVFWISRGFSEIIKNVLLTIGIYRKGKTFFSSQQLNLP